MTVSFNIHEWNTQGAGPRLSVAPYPDALRGLIVQPYLDKVPGNTPAARRATLLAAMKTWSARGVKAWAPHGFTTTLLPADAAAYVDMGRTAGLLCVPAFGLDEQNPAGKGERIAAVGRVEGVAGVILDAEGAYEGHAALYDAQVATTLGQELTAAAPNLVVIHEPWPVPQVHKEWPTVAFARFASAWNGQFYYWDWTSTYGARCYRVLDPQFADNMVALERDIFTPLGLGGIPAYRTVQLAGWGPAPMDCCALFIREQTLVGWAEWQPSPEVLHAWEARQRIDARVGLYVGGVWSGGDAVLRFQRAWNATASATARLAEDGAYGPRTDAALFQSPVTRFFLSLVGR